MSKLITATKILIVLCIGYVAISQSDRANKLQKRADQQESEIENLQYQLKMCMFLYRKCGG